MKSHVTRRFAILAALVLFVCSLTFVASSPASADLGPSKKQRSLVLTREAFDDIAKGNCDAAEKKLNEALKLNPNNLYAKLNMGVVYNNSGRFQQAQSTFQQVADARSKEKPYRVHFEDDKGATISDIAQKNLDAMGKADKKVSGACPILPEKRTEAKTAVQ